jgi:hypothetical protein
MVINKCTLANQERFESNKALHSVGKAGQLMILCVHLKVTINLMLSKKTGHISAAGQLLLKGKTVKGSVKRKSVKSICH